MQGNRRSAHLYFQGQPVGLVRDGVLYFVLPDHLGRPELLSDGQGQIAWRARLRAFDRQVHLDRIGGYGLGFPGQYHDDETGLAYNVFRDYDPATGRYTFTAYGQNPAAEKHMNECNNRVGASVAGSAVGCSWQA
ncbi:MAG: RHS domain-containing protein [Xanthomonadales bacterium]|nr:RHS domain-containing protein [Xanthomonadales bacterium]